MNQRSSSLLCNPPIYAQIWRFAFNGLLYRQRREHAVFNKLLQIIPGLEERLLNGEASEVTEIAELVFTVLTLWCTTTVTHASLIATKGSLQCPIRRHERSERGRPWLDHPSWAIPPPSHCTECQDRSRLQPWTHRGSFMSCRYGLVRFGVSVTFPMCYGSDLRWCGSIKSKLRNGEILVAGDQWPIFLYTDFKFDPEEPWKGLLRSTILVSVTWTHA